MRRIVLLVLCAGSACSSSEAPAGRSGVDPVQPVSSLSQADLQKLCAWSLQAEGGAGTTIGCDGGLSLHVKTLDQCVNGLTALTCSTITAGLYEDCSAAIGQAPCLGLDNPGCASYWQAVRGCLPDGGFVVLVDGGT